MKITRGWLLIALPCTLAACGGEEETATLEGGDTASLVTADTGGAMPMMPTTVALQALGGSSVTGQATITHSGAESQVNVQLSGLTPGEHPGHVHAGTCDAIGAVVHPLPSATAGADGSATVSGTIPAAGESFMNGQHVISYHGNADDPMVPVACGQLMAHPM